MWYRIGVQAILKLLSAAATLFVVSAQAQVASPTQKTNRVMETKIAPSGTATNATASSTAKREVAILAGGCFWGMEEVLRKTPGILDTRVGYTGGTVPNPSYRLICTGITGHAEALEIGFDPAKLSYEELLLTFFRMHDP